MKFTVEQLRKRVWYDSQTGLFHTLKDTGRSKVGDVVTNVRKDGYCRVNVFGEKLLAHRLAWFYVHAEWPKFDIDHIDGNPSNNTLSNLRVLARNENLQNIRKVRKNSQTGVNNVSWHTARQRFVVQLLHLGEHKFGGQFSDIDSAIAALEELKRTWHPFSPLVERK
jgi:hypothetical protein